MDTIITTLVTVVTAPIPFLASSGILLVIFGAMWVAFAIALVRDPARIEGTWRRVRALPLVVQAVAWVMFLPVLAGIAIWRTGWPQLLRVVLVGGLAGWNVLMFLPRPA